LEQLAEVARECHLRQVELLGVCGGDGTLARTLTALVQTYGGHALPCILPLRAGTMNTVARAMGCPAWRPERMLAEVVAGSRRGARLALTEHQLLAINGLQFGFMVGAGVPVAFLQRYYARETRGPLVAAGLLTRLGISAVLGGRDGQDLFRLRPARLVTDGTVAPFPAFTVIYASTIEDIGLGFRPTYRARAVPGRFQVFAGAIGAREFVRRLPAIRRGRPTGSPRVLDAVATHLCVEFREPTFYMIDGDIMEATTQLDVRFGPVVRVIQR
jgi:diacylglycerol kinase family enzyme